MQGLHAYGMSIEMFDTGRKRNERHLIRTPRTITAFAIAIQSQTQKLLGGSNDYIVIKNPSIHWKILADCRLGTPQGYICNPFTSRHIQTPVLCMAFWPSLRSNICIFSWIVESGCKRGFLTEKTRTVEGRIWNKTKIRERMMQVQL